MFSLMFLNFSSSSCGLKSSSGLQVLCLTSLIHGILSCSVSTGLCLVVNLVTNVPVHVLLSNPPEWSRKHSASCASALKHHAFKINYKQNKWNLEISEPDLLTKNWTYAHTIKKSNFYAFLLLPTKLKITTGVKMENLTFLKKVSWMIVSSSIYYKGH